MKRRSNLAWFLLAGLLVLSELGFAQGVFQSTLSLEPHKFRTFDGKEHDAELGRLMVRENRGSKTNQRFIQLAFVRLKSTAATPEPPIIYLAGGPGIPGTGMGRIPVYFALFNRLREVSDVLLLDQRGTGMSAPNLDCPAPKTSPPADLLSSETKVLQFYTKSLASCAAHLRAQGMELSAYTAEAIADDVDELRAALGAEKVSLIGHSFGTLLSLLAIRRHEAHLQRVVLAGVMGPEHLLHLPSSLESTLHKVSALVAQDPILKQQIPDFAALVKQVLAEFDAKNVTVTVTDKVTNQPVTIPLGKFVPQMILGGLSDGRARPGIPAQFYALQRGDYSALKGRAEGLYNSLNGFGGNAASMAFGCSGNISAARRARVAREAKQTIAGDVSGRKKEYCDAIGALDPGAKFRAKIQSKIPVLFISGTLDGTTPASQADELRRGFPRSTHLLIENSGHEPLPDAKVQKVVADFFRGQDVSQRAIKFARPKFTPTETQH